MSKIRWMAYLLVALLSVSIVSAHTWRPPHPPKFIGLGPADVPQQVGGYTAGKDYELSKEVLLALGSSTSVGRPYMQGNHSVDFTMISGSDRQALHDPRSCLVGAGYSLADDHTEKLPGAGFDTDTCRAVGKNGAQGTEILLFYVVDGKVIHDITQIRYAMLKSALLGQQGTPTYFFRFSVPLDHTGAVIPEEHARMLGFASAMWDVMKPKIIKS